MINNEILSLVSRLNGTLVSAYELAKTDFEFASIAPEDIVRKMTFISAIIGSILNDF